MPSLRQLELFRLLMRTRNVTETARLLRISQPAASQMLRSLENDLGLELFARSGGRLRATAEAMALLPTVERVFTHHGMLDSRAAELRDAQAGSLTIATIPTLTGWLLPQALLRFRQQRPRVRFLLEAHDTAGVTDLVRRENADLGLLYAPIDDPAIAAEPILSTRMVCIMPADHPLAAHATVDAATVAPHTPITLPGGVTPGILLSESLRRSRVPFAASLETNLSFAAISFVREGLGVYLSDPLILLSHMTEGLIARPFEPEISLTLAIIFSRHRPLPRIVVRFVSVLQALAEEMAARLHARGLPGSVVR